MKKLVIFCAFYLLVSVVYANSANKKSNKDLINYYKAPKYLIIKNREIISMQRKLIHKNLALKIKMEERKEYASNSKNIWKKIDIRDELKLKNTLLNKISDKEGN